MGIWLDSSGSNTVSKNNCSGKNQEGIVMSGTNIDNYFFENMGKISDERVPSPSSFGSTALIVVAVLALAVLVAISALYRRKKDTP
jgi:parallel beta-helix repeat protein